jgi:hypothetical protein
LIVGARVRIRDRQFTLPKRAREKPPGKGQGEAGVFTLTPKVLITIAEDRIALFVFFRISETPRQPLVNLHD